MDASVTVVGLFLLANLVGLILSLWACFAKFQGLAPTRVLDLVLVDSIDSTSCLLLLVLLLPVVAIQVLRLVALVGLLLRVLVLQSQTSRACS